MQINLYKVQHDKGFAPNPFWGACTLACCKSRIRKRATKGDIIVGFASAAKEIGLDGRVVYWMRVDEITDFDAYWRDSRFQMKRPQMGSGLMGCYGDNIYHRDPKTGAWIQEYSFHSDGEGLGHGNLKTDTERTDRVLIGREFAYWGENAPLFPKELSYLIPPYQGEPCHLNEEEVAAVLRWIESKPERGIRGWPVDWARDHAPDQFGRMPFLQAKETVAC